MATAPTATPPTAAAPSHVRYHGVPAEPALPVAAETHADAGLSPAMSQSVTSSEYAEPGLKPATS